VQLTASVGRCTNMPDLRSQLDPEVQRRADKELTSQVDRSFEEGIETGHKLTQHNFLVNAGGAAAVLAYMGVESTGGLRDLAARLLPCRRSRKRARTPISRQVL
jgi:hypothetical protein